MKEFDNLIIYEGKKDWHHGLSYVTHDGTNGLTARKDTGSGWADNDKHETYPNDLVEGIKIESVTTRYESDNKVFNIEDPRGFKMQIYVPNFLNTMKYSTITNGVITTKVRYIIDDNNKIGLIAESDPVIETLGHVNETDSDKGLKPFNMTKPPAKFGQVITYSERGKKRKYVFLGVVKLAGKKYGIFMTKYYNDGFSYENSYIHLKTSIKYFANEPVVFDKDVSLSEFYKHLEKKGITAYQDSIAKAINSEMAETAYCEWKPIFRLIGKDLFCFSDGKHVINRNYQSKNYGKYEGNAYKPGGKDYPAEYNPCL